MKRDFCLCPWSWSFSDTGPKVDAVRTAEDRNQEREKENGSNCRDHEAEFSSFFWSLTSASSIPPRAPCFPGMKNQEKPQVLWLEMSEPKTDSPLNCESIIAQGKKTTPCMLVVSRNAIPFGAWKPEAILTVKQTVNYGWKIQVIFQIRNHYLPRWTVILSGS